MTEALPAYSREQVLALAPDPSSQKSGQDLANVRRWLKVARGGRAIWGECQGSGGTPYQTRVDLGGPAFKCSCPSRKFPCKHGVGLLLLFSQAESAFAEAEQPKWVSEWIESREQKSTKKKDKPTEPRSQEQLEEAEAAKDKRRQNRIESVKAGVEELELFLCDLIRQGVGLLKREGYTFFELRAARLIDAQAPGLARLVRECATLTSSQTNWQESLLDRLATIYLIVSAFKNIESLPERMQADVMAAVGFTQSQEALLSEDGVVDEWYAVAQTIYFEDKLRVQRTWMRGLNSGRNALVLSFAHGTAPFDVILVPGHLYNGELVFYPSSYPLRALIKSRSTNNARLAAGKKLGTTGATTIGAALDKYAEALAAIPWLESVPLLLSAQTVVRTDDGKLFIKDDSGKALPVKSAYMESWQLSAFSEGRPLSLFGEFDGRDFQPLAALNPTSGAYLRLAAEV
jgi:hypothetical protein